MRGRRVVDDVDDARLIADELRIERFGVSGGSGGGPHALVCAEITVPVLIRYGTGHVLVPPGHGDWLAANVPGSVVKVGDAGHLGLDPVAELAEDVRWLRDGTTPA